MNPGGDLPDPTERLVRRLAAADALETHPSSAALASFDEAPEGLSPRTRQWIEAHLAACDACRAALRAVPRFALPPRPFTRLAGPFLAAAGWLLAALLGLRALATERAGRAPFPAVHTLVLSTVRGAETPAIPSEARILRCELVLGEEVELGATLHVRILARGGAVLVEEDRAVLERNERDWPVLTLDRAALPKGPVQLRVRAPDGAESVFELAL